MNETRVSYLIEVLKHSHVSIDHKFRELVKDALVGELDLYHSNEDAVKRLEVLEEHFDNVIEDKENLKEAIRLISESF